MRSPIRLTLLNIALVCLALAFPNGTPNAKELETLPSETAVADIRASEGIVFVDLYAEW
ncbi:MAG: hypothetical protein GY725_16405 [bacterium]|nr:hypothetical protein [bacterium]